MPEKNARPENESHQARAQIDRTAEKYNKAMMGHLILGIILSIIAFLALVGSKLELYIGY